MAYEECVTHTHPENCNVGECHDIGEMSHYQMWKGGWVAERGTELEEFI
jgi:hypothetical protein